MLSNQQIREMGFKSVGKNVMLSDKASYYNCKNIQIGDNVRIDDFCVLSTGVGGINIGNYIHISVGATLIGAGKITLSDFSAVSLHVSIFSSNDDYSGKYLTNPTVPSEFTGVSHADVFVGRHAIIGAGSVILPGAVLEDGVAIGALSLVSKRCTEFGVYVGSPVKKISERKRDLLELEKRFLSTLELKI